MRPAHYQQGLFQQEIIYAKYNNTTSVQKTENALNHAGKIKQPVVADVHLHKDKKLQQDATNKTTSYVQMV